MISRKTLRIAGAAILGTLVGTGPAYAVVSLPAGETMGDLTGQVYFANETLVSKVGTTEYDAISGFGGNLHLEHDLGLRVNITSGTIVRVSYEFTNYAVNTALADAALVLIDTGGSEVTVGAGTVAITRIMGGTSGASEVTFSVSGGTTGTNCAATANGCRLRLELADVGIMSDGDGAGGSVAMTASVVIGGETFRSSVTMTNPINTVVALREEVSPSTSTPTADVDEGFNTFVGGSEGIQTAAIGTIQLGVRDGPTGAIIASTNNLATATSATPVSLRGTNPIAMSGTITFTGDISFVTDVFRSTDNCATSEASLVDGTDEKTWKTSIAVDDFTAAQTICVRTDGETAIPESTYRVATSYVGGTNATYSPMGGTHTLGRIARDGTNVHIPYLTTFGSYNQRIVMRNRGTRAAGYTMSFVAEDGTTYVAGSGATGMLPAGSLTVVRARDAVTISGGSRVAASINIESSPGTVDVATVQVNTSTGSTDTVRYSATQSVTGAPTH